MTRWPTATLDSLGHVGRGRSTHRPRNDQDLYGGVTPFFQTGDVKAANFWLRNYSQTYSELGLAQSKLWPAGTLCITIAANIAESAVLALPAAFPDSVVGFVADDTKADVRFIKYAMDTLRASMQSVSHGTTQDNLSLDKLLSFQFPAPPIEIQRRIAGILSAYDDLIENCERRIKVLDEMARALYREWFVEFRAPSVKRAGKLPSGWRVDRLDSVVQVNAQQVSPRTAPAEIRYIDISSVSPDSIDSATPMSFSEAPGRARRIVSHGDILWSCVRPNRRSHALVIRPEPNTLASTGFAVLTAKKIPFAYLYLATTTDEFVKYLEQRATGAAYPAVTAPVFEEAPLLIPDDPVLEQFAQRVVPLFEMKESLRRRIANLRETRDLLLPRLLSGQLDVSDAA